MSNGTTIKPPGTRSIDRIIEIGFTAKPYQWADLSRKFQAVAVERRAQIVLVLVLVVLEDLVSDNKAA
jgi:hypothetical protein